MIEREQYIIADESLAAIGMRDFDLYADQAVGSMVPVFFYDLSRAVSLDYVNSDLDTPSKVTETLLKTKFNNDREAWFALKYAEAMAAMKLFLIQESTDRVPPATLHEEKRKLSVLVGIASITKTEQSVQVVHKVEKYFNDPISVYRLEQLFESMDSTSVH